MGVVRKKRVGNIAGNIVGNKRRECVEAAADVERKHDTD